MNPYGVYPLVLHVSFPHLGIDVDQPNLNPPFSLPFFEFVAQFDPKAGFAVWFTISAVLYLVVLVMLARAYPAHTSVARIGWALSLAGLWSALGLGQIYMPLLLVSMGAWLLLRHGRSIPAGILIGVLVALKPNFVVWPILLLLAGHWLVALTAFGFTAVLSLVPLLRYGSGVYGAWLDATDRFTTLTMPGNSSFMGFAARAGVPWLGACVGGILLLVLAVWGWRYRPPALTVSRLALIGALLAAPLAWSGYTLILLPVLWERKWTIPLRAAALILIMPGGLATLLPSLDTVLNGVHMWALLLLLLGLRDDNHHAHAAPS